MESLYYNHRPQINMLKSLRRALPRSAVLSVAIWTIVFALVAVGGGRSFVEGGEMTFELPDNEQMCFHEVIDKGVKCVLEFQVIQGGNYDVDLTLKSPRGATLYAEQKKQYDRYEWTTDEQGEYRFCFSNEFSTFTHKLVYFDFQVGDEELLRVGSSSSPLTAMTQMETSVLNVHQSLKVVIDYQTHHRLRESQGRSFAEDINEQVQAWSIGQTVVIVLASIGQILILRSFFSERKTFGSNVGRMNHS